MVARRQHYVWRHYLEMWQGEDDSVWCFRNQKIFTTNPTNIMVEKDFYKLQELTREDIDILQEFVKKTTPSLRNTHKALVANFAFIAEASKRLQVDPKASSADRETARKMVIESAGRVGGRFPNSSFTTPRRRISAYPARPSG